LNGIHGTAQWYPSYGSSRIESFDGSRIILGHVPGNKSEVFAAPPERHFLTVSPTRSGKGVSHIIPNLLTYRGSCIVIDPKGENAWITAEHRRSMGHKVYIVDPWNEMQRRFKDNAIKDDDFFDIQLNNISRPQKNTPKKIDPDKPSKFNPLSILDPFSEHYTDDLMYLADSLIIDQSRDPHWPNSAKELLAGIISCIVESDPPENQTLSMVRCLLTKPSEDITEKAKKVQEFDDESIAKRKLGRFTSKSKEIDSIISTAVTQTAFLDSPALNENMSESDFDFDELLNGKTTIYLVLPVDKLNTHGRWLRLMISIAIRTIARSVKSMDLPVLFILDEFGTIGPLPAISQAYGLMAGLNMCIWAFVQDLNQLKRDYPDDWQTFISNSHSVIGFALMDHFTCEEFSKMLGKTTVEILSRNTRFVREGLFGDPNHIDIEDKHIQRDLQQPSELRRLGQKHGIIIWRGAPILFEKISYNQDLFFLEKARFDPNYPEMVKIKEELERFKNAAEKIIPNLYTAIQIAKDHFYKREDALYIKHKLLGYNEEYSFSSDESLIKWVRENLALKKPFRFRY